MAKFIIKINQSNSQILYKEDTILVEYVRIVDTFKIRNNTMYNLWK